MVKKVIKFEASDGSQWPTKEEAEQREKTVALYALLEVVATRGLHANIHQFFADNIDLICDITDAYRKLDLVKKKR